MDKILILKLAILAGLIEGKLLTVMEKKDKFQDFFYRLESFLPGYQKETKGEAILFLFGFFDGFVTVAIICYIVSLIK